MAHKIQVRRGLKQDLPVLDSGEFGLAHDTQEVFMGLGEENLPLARRSDLTHITPEMFGAKGDGVADDTVALQSAVAYVEQNKVLLKSTPDKVYLISSTINVANADLDNLHLKTNLPIDMLKIDYFERAYQGSIRNLLIDMNNVATCGMNVVRCRQRVFEKLNFKNVGTTAIKIMSQSGGTMFNHVFMYGGANNAVGIEVHSSDCHFTDIYAVDIHTMLINDGSNYYTRCHGWMDTKDWIPNSTLMQIDSGKVWLEQCYPDTFHNAYVLNGLDELHISKNYIYINGFVLNSTVYAACGSHIYGFKINDANIMKKVKMNDCSFIGPSWGAVGNGQLEMASLDSTSTFMVNTTNYLAGVESLTREIKKAITVNATNVSNAIVNDVKRMGDVVSITFRGVVPVAVTSTETVLGTLPDTFLTPNVTQVNQVGLWGLDANTAEGTVYVYVKSTGEVCVKRIGATDLTANGARQISFNLTYTAPKSII